MRTFKLKETLSGTRNPSSQRSHDELESHQQAVQPREDIRGALEEYRERARGMRREAATYLAYAMYYESLVPVTIEGIADGECVNAFDFANREKHFEEVLLAMRSILPDHTDEQIWALHNTMDE